MKNNFKNLTIVSNPLVEHNLTIIRDKNTNSVSFRNAISILSTSLSLEATKNLPLKEVKTATPICETKTKIIDSSYNIFVVPILRAGLGIAEHLYNLLPFSIIQHLGMYRDEKTKQPVWYYNKTPKKIKNPNKTLVYLCDPMLATGGSITEAIKLYLEKGVLEENITLLNIICAPEGIQKVNNQYKKVKIYTNAVDEKLNENKFIVPGLGDAGDRIFNTI